LTVEYRALMCAFLVPGRSMWHYPEIDAGKVYRPGTLIVLATEERDVFATANLKMTGAGMPLQLITQRRIADGGVEYWLTFVKVASVPS
jgi:hypothetical protein